MTLQEFNSLSETDKLKAIWDAKLVSRNLEGNILISNHDFIVFFVELKYNAAENHVLQIHTKSKVI